MNLETLFTEGDWVWEHRLIHRLGLNRDELRKLRLELLEKNADWRNKKNRVEISRSGVAKLAAHLKLPSAPPEAVQTTGAPNGATPEPEQKKGGGGESKGVPGAPKEELVTLRVWRVFPRNKHIIEAYRPETDPAKRENIFNVQVRDSSRFTRFNHLGKPMELACRHLHHSFYEHAGPLPKRKGRA